MARERDVTRSWAARVCVGVCVCNVLWSPISPFSHRSNRSVVRFRTCLLVVRGVGVGQSWLMMGRSNRCVFIKEYWKASATTKTTNKRRKRSDKSLHNQQQMRINNRALLCDMCVYLCNCVCVCLYSGDGRKVGGIFRASMAHAY